MNEYQFSRTDPSTSRRLRAETTMTLNWVAKQLNMGTAGSLANLLREKK